MIYQKEALLQKKIIKRKSFIYFYSKSKSKTTNLNPMECGHDSPSIPLEIIASALKL
jgi:hypothetical protein